MTVYLLLLLRQIDVLGQLWLAQAQSFAETVWKRAYTFVVHFSPLLGAALCRTGDAYAYAIKQPPFGVG
jgi:hypothetical protein